MTFAKSDSHLVRIDKIREMDIGRDSAVLITRIVSEKVLQCILSQRYLGICYLSDLSVL